MKTMLEVVTSACLKCKHIRCENTLNGPEIYCKKGYESPHIKQPDRWVGVCDYLDYDEKSISKIDFNRRFLKAHMNVNRGL